jgi:hypothetical protein
VVLSQKAGMFSFSIAPSFKRRVITQVGQMDGNGPVAPAKRDGISERQFSSWPLSVFRQLSRLHRCFEDDLRHEHSNDEEAFTDDHMPYSRHLLALP